MNDINAVVEPVHIFYEIGMMVLLFVVAWGVYQYFRFVQQAADKEENYNDVERVGLDEMVKRKHPHIWQHKLFMEATSKKTFRKRLEEELVQDFFKEKKQSEPKPKK